MMSGMALSSQFRKLAAGLLVVAGFAYSATLSSTLKTGKADLKSAGPIAFGPEGILFVGDPMGAQVFAIATGDTATAAGGDLAITGVGEKIAALLGTTPDQILINDLAVNPSSKNVYLSVSRGKGPDAPGVLIKVARDGKVTELDLSNVAHS